MKKQGGIAQSSTKAEFEAIASSIKELLWVENINNKLEVQLEISVVYDLDTDDQPNRT